LTWPNTFTTPLVKKKKALKTKVQTNCQFQLHISPVANFVFSIYVLGAGDSSCILTSVSSFSPNTKLHEMATVRPPSFQVSLSGRRSAYNGRSLPIGATPQCSRNRAGALRSVTLMRAPEGFKAKENPKGKQQVKKNAYAHWLANQPEVLPTGEMIFTPPTEAQLRSTSLKLFFQPLWKQIRWGSFLGVEVGGTLSDTIGSSPFSSEVTLPQLCSCLKKAAHDPRIAGIYLKIAPLGCGWAKLDELRRHIQYFRQSGKFCVAYMEVASEKVFTSLRHSPISPGLE